MPHYVVLDEHTTCFVCGKPMRKGTRAVTDGKSYWHDRPCETKSMSVIPR
jgi:hypothetical protein